MAPTKSGQSRITALFNVGMRCRFVLFGLGILFLSFVGCSGYDIQTIQAGKYEFVLCDRTDPLDLPGLAIEVRQQGKILAVKVIDWYPNASINKVDVYGDKYHITLGEPAHFYEIVFNSSTNSISYK
ncbi:MAG: hypothetical protein SFX18_13565 [Pirellulales bacterium]|nr:hypothetical protein [Pirellulales bacterium]